MTDTTPLLSSDVNADIMDRMPATLTVDDLDTLRDLHAKVTELYNAYQVIKPAVERMSSDLSDGGLMALAPVLMSAFRPGRQ